MKKIALYFVLIAGMMTFLLSGIHAKKSDNSKPTYFKTSELKSWSKNMTDKEVLKKYGKTLSGESTVSEVYKKNQNDYYKLEYDGISFFYNPAKKLDSIEISSSRYPIFRGIKIGMPAKELLQKFPCNNSAIKTYTSSKTAKLSDVKFKDDGYGVFQMDLYTTKNSLYAGVIEKRDQTYTISYYDYSTKDDFFQGICFEVEKEKIVKIEMYFVIEND